ncbi:MAG: hypothetical protein HFE45_08690 [Oscillospiraceae bacterium]|jgi:hypothetical protein|nr:hypothetical protein [Oscillospiraceae bacterium]
MRTILTEMLLESLKPALPGVMLAVGEIKKGLSRPCLQLLPEALSLKQELSRRWRWGEEMTLNWYPPAGEPPEEAGGRLMLLAKKAAPSAAVTAETEGDHLKLHIEWEQLYFLDGQEAERMKRMVLGFNQPGG